MDIYETISFKVIIEDFLIVTHAVPSERVRPHVPAEIELDLIKGPEGEDFALVSATCFLNQGFHWTPPESPSLDFHQSTYRTYIRQDGDQAVYFFGNYLERGIPFALERLAMKNTYPADFDIAFSYNPVDRSYRRYYCEIISDKGDTIIEASSTGQEPEAYTPFNTGKEMAHFITYRPVGYFSMTGGKLGSMRVEHAEMNPVNAELLAGQFDLWEDLGIVFEEEFEQPYSVLIQPSVELAGYPLAPK